MGTTAKTETQAESRTVDYNLPGIKRQTYKLAGDVPEALRGMELSMPEAETDEAFDTLVENGASDRRKLAQGALDINRQRIFRTVANSDEVVKLIAEGKVDEAKAAVQAAGDGYVYGATNRGTGTGAITKAKAAKADAIAQAAAADPELAAKLAALGISL